MSFNYDRYSRQQRRSVRSGTSSSGSASYIPLILTISAATVGLVGWIWSQRHEEDDDYNYYYDSSEEDDRRKVQRKRDNDRPVGPENPPSFREEPRPGETSYVDVQRDSSTTEWREQDEEEAQGIVARMSGAIRRTPSPQQMFDTTRKSVVAGVAAASAAVGKGLSAITEEDKDEGFNDHETWSEEAETRESTIVPDTAAAATAAAAGAAMTGSMVSGSRGIQSQSGVRGRRKTVAIVISAEGDFSGRAPEGDSYNLEHASILTHLSNSINPDTTNVLVLIYAPYLSKHPLANTTPTDSRPPRDLSNASSYSNISVPTPVDPASAESDVIQQYSTDEPGTLYAAMAAQAQRLVSHPTNIMPFTTANGHIHMLRHLSPNVVYIQESLCGNGAVVKDITGWTGQVVIVLGAEGAGGGLIDTETEDEGAGKRDERKFWMDESIVGLGKADVVDGEKIAEDWAKRIGN